MDQSEDQGKINRRQMLGLGAVGVSTVGLAAFSSVANAGPAAAQSPPGGGSLNPLGDQLAPSSVTPGTAGVYYRKLGVFDFFDITTGDRVYNGSVYPASSSSFLAAAVDFPDGSTVSEMSIWAVNTSSSAYQIGLWSRVHDASAFFIQHAFVNVPAGTSAVTEFKITLAHIVSNDRNYLVGGNMTNTGTQGLFGGRVGFVAAGAVTLVPSARVLNNVTVGNGSNVLVDCAARVAPGSRAAIVTILAFQTTSDGYYTCYADGGANPGTINAFWSAGAQTATAAIVPLSAAGRFRLALTSTGGSAGAAVDISGYVL